MLLEVRELEVHYGKKRVLDNVSLDVGEREVVALIGHNGAAKSTLMSAIFGVVGPTRGRVTYRGQDITGRKPAANLRDGIAYAPQGAEVFRSLSVVDNLMLGGFALAEQRQVAGNVERVFELFPALEARRRMRAGALSGGERQMLALGMLLVASPRLAILDEPSGGLSPLYVERVFSAIKEIAGTFRASVLLVEQNVSQALAIADRVYVLAHGRITFTGDPRTLDSAEALSRTLLGL